MTPGQIRLEAARMRQRADALMRLARWHEAKTTTERVLELSLEGSDAASIAAVLCFNRNSVQNIRTNLKRRGLLRA